jgi:ribosome-associated protein
VPEAAGTGFGDGRREDRHPPEAGMLEITPQIRIGEDELDERFVRSPGPGGQNVNKVSTAVQLSYDVARSPSLPEPVRRRLMKLAGRRIDKDGVLTIEAHRHRTRERNRADARERLAELVARAASAPKPRVPTRPSRKAKARRLDAKRQRSHIKQLRRGPGGRDD